MRPLLSWKKVQVRPSSDLLCTPFVLRVSASSLDFVGWVSVYEQRVGTPILSLLCGPLARVVLWGYCASKLLISHHC